MTNNSTVEFLIAFHDVQKAIKLSSARVDELKEEIEGLLFGDSSSPNPISPKNKSKSNHPLCSV